jgi:hypothetical protein
MTDETIRYIFLLSALLIVAAYFVGASTDTNSLANGMNKLILSLTGRTSSGSFAAYPSGGGTVQGG